MLKTFQHDLFGLFLSCRVRVSPGACSTGSVRSKCLLSCISKQMNPSEERNLLAGRSSSWKQHISEDNRSAAGFCGEETHRDIRTSQNFTQEELKIHRIHREACLVGLYRLIDNRNKISSSWVCLVQHEIFGTTSFCVILFLKGQKLKHLWTFLELCAQNKYAKM